MKIKLTILFFVLLFINKSNAQVIIHGSTSTKFYRWDGSVLYKLTSGEVWVNDPSSSASVSGIISGTGLVWTAQSNYDQGDEPFGGGFNLGEKYVSCFEASNEFNKGACGPQSTTIVNGVVTTKCWNSNSNGCSIVLANGSTIFSDGNGNF